MSVFEVKILWQLVSVSDPQLWPHLFRILGAPLTFNDLLMVCLYTNFPIVETKPTDAFRQRRSCQRAKDIGPDPSPVFSPI